MRQLLESFSDDAANELTAGGKSEDENQELTIKVDGFLVLCTFDSANRILIVRDVSPTTD